MILTLAMALANSSLNCSGQQVATRDGSAGVRQGDSTQLLQRAGGRQVRRGQLGAFALLHGGLQLKISQELVAHQLAKHFGLLVERIEHTGSVDLVHRLQAARQRGKPVPDVLVEATPVEE